MLDTQGRPYGWRTRVRRRLEIGIGRVMWLCLVLFFVGAFTGPALVQLFLPEPVSYPALPLRILPSRVVAGQAHIQTVTGMRCATDPLAVDGKLTISYTRRIVSEDQNYQRALDPGTTDIPLGCVVSTNVNNVLPAWVPPGRYYMDGWTTGRGSKRSPNPQYWRSDMFEVVPPGQLDDPNAPFVPAGTPDSAPIPAEVPTAPIPTPFPP